MKKISKSTWAVIIVILLVALTIFIWFNAEKIMMYAKINSPVSKPWASIQLLNGEILYGHLAGVTPSLIGLKDVFTLEKIMPINPNPVASSSSFSVSELTGIESSSKLIPFKSSETLFINRPAIIYFKFVDENDAAYPYLK